jgi:predicted PurR-regulated permease PerM
MASDFDRSTAATTASGTPWWRTLLYGLLIAASGLVAFLIFQKYLYVAALIVLLAGILTYLLQPGVEWLVKVSRLRNIHLARVSAVLLIYLGIGLFLFGMGAAVKNTIVEQWNTVSSLYARGVMPPQVKRLQRWYIATVPEEMRLRLATDFQTELHKSENMQKAAQLAAGLSKHLGEWMSLLIELIVVPLIAFYFLTDGGTVGTQVLDFVPPHRRESVVRYSRGMNEILRHYVQGQIILAAIAWVVFTVLLLLLRVPGALLLGIVAGLSRAIPMFGPMLGGVFILGAVWLNPATAGLFWWVLIGFCALHLFESKFLMPRILGDHLGIHPIVVIVSLLIGYEFLGMLGMFLAPPVVAMIRFILAVRRGEGPFAADTQLPLPGLSTEGEAVGEPASE